MSSCTFSTVYYVDIRARCETAGPHTEDSQETTIQGLAKINTSHPQRRVGDTQKLKSGAVEAGPDAGCGRGVAAAPAQWSSVRILLRSSGRVAHTESQSGCTSEFDEGVAEEMVVRSARAESNSRRNLRRGGGARGEEGARGRF